MASAGIAGNLDFSELTSTEDQIVRKLSKDWLITFVKASSFKNIRYAFVFAKPTSFLVTNFHLSREILVVFNNENQFEPRVLDFVDKTMNEFQNRLDKLCVLLVSGDKDIKNKIRNMAIQDKESRIIIPFSFSEFSATQFKDTSHIISRLREFFYNRDLFAFDSPLRNDTYFFGRSQIIQQLYGKYKAGENGCLFGLRRIGKTSVLLAVQRQMTVRNEPILFLDCSETAFHMRRWNEVLYFMVSNLINRLKLVGKVKIHDETDYTEKDASRYFEIDLQLIYNNIKKRILFVLDEIESITFDISSSKHWAEDRDFIYFWQSIRSIYQKNPNLFSIIVVGVNPKAIETPTVQGFDNPIYRFITPVYLGLFSVDEVKDMVSSIGSFMGLQFDDEVYTYLTDDYGGHPFLIRQVCSQIHKSASSTRPFAVTKFHYRIDSSKLNRSIYDYIELIISILKERYKDEYELLELLAQGDRQTFQYFVDKSHALIEHLQGYGLIKEDHGSYHFRIKVVENFIKEKSEIAKIPTTKEDKWREISTRRNKLENDLRRVVKLVLKLNFGVSQAKNTFLDIVSPPNRKDKLSALSFDGMFSSEVYFEDLRKVMGKNWSIFGKVFGNNRENFDNYMNFVNKHRADAHANDIDDETLGILLIALQWLQRQVDGFLE